MTLLGEEEVEAALRESQWRRVGATIVRDFKLADFREAIGFIDRVAEVAEELDHHPDILLHGYNKVRLELSTHSQGGLTSADFALAGRIDALQ